MADTLVSCEWLNEQIKGGQPKDLVIIDVSWSSTRNCQEEYNSDHIPGATYLNVMDAEHNELFPRNIPELASFQKAARDAGVNNSSHVVLYSNSDHCSFFMSGRAWWTFQIFGHPHVSVLNGGLQKWKSLNYPTTNTPTDIKVGNFEAKWNPKYYRKIEDIKSNLPSQQFQLIDTRAGNAPTEKGKIPGTQHIPLSSLLDSEQQQMKSLVELKKLFEEVDFSKPITSHCNSGMSSCTVAMAAKMCGAEDVSVFHGGFTEWKSKASDQIEKSD